MTDFSTTIEIDADAIPLECDEGTFTGCRCVRVDVRANKTGLPLIIAEFSVPGGLVGSDGEPVDGLVTEFCSLFPAGHKGHRIGLQRLIALMRGCGVSAELLPRQAKSPSDFDDMKLAMVGSEAAIIVRRGSGRDGMPVLRLTFVAP